MVLFTELAKACDGHSVNEVLEACINVIANCIRQNYGTRREAEARMNELYGSNMTMLMEHYDPTTGRRRSIVPFTQVISPGLVENTSIIPTIGKSNGPA